MEEVPQLTFVEEEVQVLVDFFNIVSNRARFDFSAKDAVAFANLASKYKTHLEKVESHVLELKRIIKPKKKD
jgi:hypothetical protein